MYIALYVEVVDLKVTTSKKADDSDYIDWFVCYYIHNLICAMYKGKLKYSIKSI